jgi:putative ABC transport system permease protein
MRALDRKLLRDLRRLWAQVLAIAFVMAAGVATLILAMGAHASLEETRAAYYTESRFAHIFAQVTRAPKLLKDEIARLPGVAAVETRITKLALLDIPNMREPTSGLFVSLPDVAPAVLNLITLKRGRFPKPGAEDEVVVNEAFAAAHRFEVGATFSAILNGHMRPLTIVGIGLSPEFIYALGPADLMPDDRRFGVIWMSEDALAAAYDLEGAFSAVSLRLTRDAREQEIIDRLDALLARWGGRGSHGRRDQTSHAFLDAELRQLEAMARVMPPIFLVVTAFLVNMTLGRLVTLEREQIGLLKAIGYSTTGIVLHYLKFAICIALCGIIIGSIAGSWLGVALTRLYGAFFHFPFLIFRSSPQVYLFAWGVTAGAALAGALGAVWRAAGLPPAVAMQPAPPVRYDHLWIENWGLSALLPPAGIMVIRNLVRFPGRALSTLVGIALATAILVSCFSIYDSVDEMIDIQFFRAERQDASIDFTSERSIAAQQEIARLPGVMTVEPYRSIPVRLRHGAVERRVAIVGKPHGSDLSRVLDIRDTPVLLPETGIALSEMLARILNAEVGDLLEVELLEKNRRDLLIPVTTIIQGYLGLTAYMDLAAVNRLNREGSLISGVHFAFDPKSIDALFARVKEIPEASSIALQRVSLQKFRETLAENLLFMVGIYVTLAVTIAFGVVYNSSRVALSERGREFASLRVLGFTRREVSWILLAELAALTLLAQPPGWLLGYGASWLMSKGLENELYRIPLVVSDRSRAIASLVVAGAAFLSALVVRRRIDRLDLVAVLKTRE